MKRVILDLDTTKTINICDVTSDKIIILRVANTRYYQLHDENTSAKFINLADSTHTWNSAANIGALLRGAIKDGEVFVFDKLKEMIDWIHDELN